MTRDTHAAYRRRQKALQDHINAAVAEITAEKRAAAEALKVRRREAVEAEKARPKLTAADVAGAVRVRDQFGWHRVVRVNAKSVTVVTPYTWTDRIPLAKILDVRGPSLSSPNTAGGAS